MRKIFSGDSASQRISAGGGGRGGGGKRTIYIYHSMSHVLRCPLLVDQCCLEDLDSANE